MTLTPLVYALYKYCPKIGTLALCMAVSDATVVFLAGNKLFHGDNFNIRCSTRPDGIALAVPYAIPYSLIFVLTHVHNSFRITFSSFQVITWTLIWYKQRQLLAQGLVQRMFPLLPILFRDKTISMLAVASKCMLLLFTTFTHIGTTVVGFAAMFPFSVVVRIDTLAVYP